MENAKVIIEIIAALLTIVGLSTGVSLLIKKKNKQSVKNGSQANNSEGDAVNTNDSTISSGKGGITLVGNNNSVSPILANAPTGNEESNIDIVDLKETCRILFIDDDKKPTVIKTLTKSGWKNINRIGDTANLDLLEIRAANIIFVDIKGVGLLLQFKNEGIGLAAALKDKYKDKGVVIYSATEEHNLFDPDLKKVDDWLYKNAEPIQFSNMIEQYGKPKN